MKCFYSGMIRESRKERMKHTTMKQLPQSEQPYERCVKNGAKSLTDAQLLAVLLRSGTKDNNVLAISEALLNLKEDGLLGLTRLTRKELSSVHGIGLVKTIQLECLIELSIRLAQTVAKPKQKLTDPKEVASLYMHRLRYEKCEELIAIFLDNKCRIIAEKVMSIGTMNSALISPREIFMEALEHSAVYLILLHNHPSGDPTPSNADIDVTTQIKQGGELIGIHLLDHIIIGDNKFISMKESKLI